MLATVSSCRGAIRIGRMEEFLFSSIHLSDRLPQKWRQPSVILAQLRHYLYCQKIFNAYLNSIEPVYSRALAKFKEPSGLDADPANHRRPLPAHIKMDGMHAAMRAYQIMGDSIMIFVFFKNLLPLKTMLEHLGASPETSHCYLVGRLVLIAPLPETVSLLFAFAHLCWRITMYSGFRQFDLNLISFLSADPLDIEAEQMHIENESKLWKFTDSQLYLISTMYYSLTLESRQIFQLKPNRTREARRMISSFVNGSWYVAFAFFCSLLIIITPVVMLSLVRDIKYVENYPKCSIELDELKAQGKLGWWSTSLRFPHKNLSNIIDLSVNFFVWLESAWSLLFGLTMTYLFEVDLLLYFRDIKLKLCRLKDISWRNYYLYHERLEAHRALPSLSAGSSDRRHKPKLEDCLEIEGHTQSAIEKSRIDFMVLSLQSEINDFFRDLKLVDHLVSDIITASIIIWLAIFAYTTYLSISYPDQRLDVEVTFLETVAVITSLVEHLLVSILRRNILGVYQTICTAMAYDRSSYRLKFKGTLEFYTMLQRTSFTILHRIPYTSTSFLTIVGWSFTVATIAQNFLRKS